MLTNGILVDHQLEALLDSAVATLPGAAPIDPRQIQPASIDLRLGPIAHRVRAGFLPEHVPVEQRLAELATSEISLEGGAVLERGLCYLVRLEERLALPGDVSARFNPRSSTGRCDVFTRVLVPGHPRFDEAPAGYEGELWLEIAPLSFPVRLERGSRLTQLRLTRGTAALTRSEVAKAHAATPLVHAAGSPLPPSALALDDEGALALRVGLAGRDPCGWRSARNTEVVRFAEEGAHAVHDFWEELHAENDHCVLEPETFYVFASKERVSVPPHLAAEMLPIDVGIGELRNNYAGFFDPGFGWSRDSGVRGTPAVLEVRAHDVPFLVEDGQVFFRLRFFRLAAEPRRLYGEGREGASYRAQDLTLARPFRARPTRG